MEISVNSIFNDILTKIGQKLPFDYDLSALSPHARSVSSESAFAALFDETVKALETEDGVNGVNAEEYIDPIVTGSGVSGEAALSAAVIGGETVSAEVYNALLESCAKYNIDVNLVRAVIKVESDYNQYDVSTSGAMGLMQLMPGTAEGLGVTDPYSVSQNIEGGTRYLREMIDMFGGDESLALAAYNAGPNAVKRYGGVPPYAETTAYVPRVLDYRRRYADKLSGIQE